MTKTKSESEVKKIDCPKIQDSKAKYLFSGFFVNQTLKQADLHSAEKNNPVNCFSRGGGCERSERRPEVTKTKVSANLVKRTTCFCEGNQRHKKEKKTTPAEG